MTGQRVYIGLGSNLENPLAQVTQAIRELAQLPESELVATSPWYSSVALGPGEQPDYINGVACLNSRLSPEALLDALQAIEYVHGRKRAERWGARTLDLDLLLYGQEKIDTPRLQVPHPWLRHRNFVLLPLADVAPELVLPGGTPLREIVAQTSRVGITRLNPQ